MGGFILRLRNWWDTSDRTQRVVTLGGLGVLVLLLVGTFIFASRPNYGIAFSGLSEEEKGTIAKELQTLGIPCKYDQPGVIEVPTSQISDAKMKLAMSGKLPQKAQQWGLTELKENPFGATPAIEKERLRQITEGELAKSIVTIQGIQSARVHIALPPTQVFVRDQKPVTASISLIQEDEQLPSGAGKAIARLVTNSVEGLEMKNVVIVNQRGETLFSGDEDANGSSSQTKKIDIDDEVSRKRQRELQAKLDTFCGIGATIVSVHADVDLDPQSVIRDEVTPKPIAVGQSSEEMTGTGGKGRPGGTAGTAGQVATPTGGASDSKDSNYRSSTTQSQTVLKDATHTETTKALGSIRGMAINVVADSERVQDGDALRKYLQGELLYLTQFDTDGNASKKSYAVSVNLVPFDKKSAADAKEEKSKAESAARMQQIISLLPIAALLLVALLVIKQIGKFAKTQLPEPVSALPYEHAHDHYTSALGDDEDGTHAISGGGNSLLAALGASTSTTEDMEEESLEVGEIKDRVHVPLEQIKKMAAEKPAVVGMLIKSMLLEDRR